MRVDPDGLAALAARLTASATSTAAAIPAETPHPPLATDTVSAGAAARLTAAGGILAGNAAGHVTDLGELAARLAAVAGAFGAQEAANAAAQSAVVVDPRRSDAQLPPPLVRPTVAPDVRPPLAPAPPVGGETVAAQYAAGSAEAGGGFAQGWTGAAGAFRQAASDLRDAAAWLPEVWRTTAPGAVLASVFTSRAAGFDRLAAQAERLSQQGSAHAQGFQTAVRSAPTPDEFAANRQNLHTAQINNARTGGLYSAHVAALTSERSRLEQRAAVAHTTYFTDSIEATAPSPAPGETPEPEGAAPGLDDSPAPGGGMPGDTNSAGIDPATGLPTDALAAGAAGLDDPMLAQMMPMLLSTLVGGLGAMVGSLVQPLSALPSQVLSAGAGAIQSATSALGAAAQGIGAPGIPDINPGDLPDISGLGGGGGVGGATTPAAGIDGLPPVAGAGPMTAPSSPPAAAAGSVPTTATAAGPAGMGGGMMPPMVPPMGGGAGGAGQDKDPKRETRIALPDRPNSEPVSGEIQERVEAVAAGTERVPPPPQPSGPKTYRITTPESDPP